METSPLTNPLESASVLHRYPVFDDPYAHVTGIDPITNHQFYYIENLIEREWLTERDINIVKTIFVHRCMTFAQIHSIFFPDCSRLETVRKRLGRLVKYGLIRRVSWGSYSKNKSECPVLYELGASGADILKYKYSIQVGSRDPRSSKPSTLAFKFKYVVTNQLYMELSKLDLKHFEFNPVLKLNDEVQVPMAYYVLQNPKGMDIQFHLLCYREDEKWMKTLTYQLDFFRRYYQAEDRKRNILVIHVSDDAKAECAVKVVHLAGLSFDPWFITDSDLYNKEVPVTSKFFMFESDGSRYYYDLS